MLVHHFLAVVEISEILVVRPAEESHLFRSVAAASTEGVVVVELEVVAFCAAVAVISDKRTLIAIACTNGSPDWCRNVS